MEGVVKVACVQAEPVAFEREATIDKLEHLVAEVAGADARLALFPEAFIPVYPSNRWVRYLAGGGDGTAVFGRLARESITIPRPDSDRLREIAPQHRILLPVGADELEHSTIYNSPLLSSPH